jgi:hypothetical protein
VTRTEREKNISFTLSDYYIQRPEMQGKHMFFPPSPFVNGTAVLVVYRLPSSCIIFCISRHYNKEVDTDVRTIVVLNKGLQAQRGTTKWFSSSWRRPEISMTWRNSCTFFSSKRKSRQTEYHKRLKMKDQYWPSPLGDAKTEWCSSTWRWFDPFRNGICQEHRPQRMLVRIKTDVSSPSAIFFPPFNFK